MTPFIKMGTKIALVHFFKITLVRIINLSCGFLIDNSANGTKMRRNLDLEVKRISDK